MKKILLSILILGFNHLISDAQQKFEPQILILSPGNVTFDPLLKKEVDGKDAEIKNLAAQRLQQPITLEGQPNIRLMQQSTINFLKNITYAKEISLFTQDYLTYRFYEKFTNCLLLVKDTTTEGKDNIKRIATAEHSPYIVNFPRVSFYKEKEQTFCKMTVQLYEQESNGLLIDKEYVGNWNNPGFEFACDQGSIGCTINNALSQALHDIIVQIATNNPTLKRERALAKQRSSYIESVIYPRPFDASLIRGVIPADSTKVELNNLYQCFYNDDRTQLVGFFIKKSTKKGSLLKDKEDKDIKVITSKDIHDKEYLDQSPAFYAYLVKGIKYNGKWYFEKSEVTYFDAENLNEAQLQYLNNLQKWDFFAKDSVDPSSRFWEGKLFQKIEDKRKDPNWEKYKDMWAMEERENRDYIGMYELIADKLKEKNKADNDNFRKQVLTEKLLPIYNEQIRLKANHFKALKGTTAQYNLIYPKDRHVVLNPMIVTDESGNQYIRYFVLITQTNDVFEWTLIKPYLLKKEEYTSEPIIKAISTFTDWNYSYQTLDNDDFWNEKVLAKEGNNYKYLNKLK